MHCHPQTFHPHNRFSRLFQIKRPLKSQTELNVVTFCFRTIWFFKKLKTVLKFRVFFVCLAFLVEIANFSWKPKFLSKINNSWKFSQISQNFPKFPGSNWNPNFGFQRLHKLKTSTGKSDYLGSVYGDSEPLWLIQLNQLDETEIFLNWAKFAVQTLSGNQILV